MLNFYLGIDPGVGGGMACLYTDRKGEQVDLQSNNITEEDIFTWLSQWKRVSQEAQNFQVVAFIEKVGGFMGSGSPKEGAKNRASGHTMFTFGQSYGGLRMALIANRIPFQEVLPKTWQKGIGIIPKAKGETQPQWKGRLKGKAQQLFPDSGVTLATADALLIAHYCRIVQSKII